MAEGRMLNYSEKLKDPRWQKKRLEIFERDGWKCRRCKSEDKTLTVHHLKYKQGAEPWGYDNIDLLTLCEPCHSEEYEWRARAEQDLLDRMRLPGVFAVEMYALAYSIELARMITPGKSCDELMTALIDTVYEYFEVRKP